jgi:signal transduction histidine kinase
VYYTWSWLDFVNVVFFILGAYFFGVLAREKVSIWEKVLFVALCIPAFLITVSGNALTEFTQTYCEAASNEWLTYYKLFAEVTVVGLMIFSLIAAWKRSDSQKRVQLSVILIATLLFFGVFSGTEFIATITGVYEINLYGLFVLPLFLIIMTFAITDLRLFQFRFVSTQVLAYVLIIMVGSQLIFIEDTTSRTLSLITLAVSLFMGVLLIENAKREEEARIRIEDLAKTLKDTNSNLDRANERLKEMDQAKNEFLSIASHQLRAPITAVRGYSANILEGVYGKVPEKLKDPLETVQESARLMASSIEDYLNISRIEQNNMKYEKSTFDVRDLTQKIAHELSLQAKKRKLTLTANGSDEPVMVNADIGKIKQVIANLVDNAIKYTEKGGISISTKKEGGKAHIEISDTGVGINPEEIGGLFEKFKRARGANKVNTTGTGLGLFVAKQLIEGHGGTVSAKSEGVGKGSTFIIELPL